MLDRLLRSRVADELQQVAVGIAEIDADTLAAAAEPRHRSFDDRDAVLLQMLEGGLGCSRPHEAIVATADHRMRRLQRDLVVGRMQVETMMPEAEADHRPFARAPLLEAISLGAEDA